MARLGLFLSRVCVCFTVVWLICVSPQVSKEEGAQLAAEYGIQFFETSAKTDINVEKGFITIAREVKDRLMADGPTPGSRAPRGVDLNQQKPGRKANCC